jgi:GNAT superfamily N-acetyltransferase
MPNSVITRVTDRQHEAEIRELETEYFAWGNAQLEAEFGIALNTDRMIERDLNELEMYFPPRGGLFLAHVDDALAGMIFLTELRPKIGQIRRMYVRDAYRRRGIARDLFETAIAAARDLRFSDLLLESPMSWQGAHALYREMGFQDVPMYAESEVPENLRKYWVFMGLGL